MAKRNEGIASGDRIDYRIGINLGDVMADGSDIAGDGVNVASRLESMADPGGICVSGSVREQVHGQMAVAFEDIGEQQVKNIERPIRVFRVGISGVETRERRPTIRIGQPRAIATLAAILAIVVVVWFTYVRILPKAPVAPPMSIAVMPLAITGEGIDAQALGNRLTQHVISAL